ncbi:MAG: dihydropteroate synthase [Alphaproteobacteria bacterium]
MYKNADEIMELLKAGKPLIMGVLNVTPDSFSDGGDYYAAEKAARRATDMIEQGAAIIDVGGESTRPGAETVPIEEEKKRVLPVIKALRQEDVPIISIDTRNAETMRAAIEAGANFVNDISGLTYDEQSASIVAQSGLPVCIMHMKGTPQTMQSQAHYDDVCDEVLAFFEQRLIFCDKQGIQPNKIILDPGIGFGKTLEHNLTLIKNLKKFHDFGCPILLGVSRKSFIGTISKEENPKNRVPGSIAAALYGLESGVQIFRVHDVKETRQAFDVYDAIKDIL